MTPEGKVKEKVKAVFKRHGVYYHMPVQNGMGDSTLDFVACCNGRFIAVETKAPGKKPTPRQEVVMDKMRKSGAFVFMVSSDAELLVLEATVQLLLP